MEQKLRTVLRQLGQLDMLLLRSVEEGTGGELKLDRAAAKPANTCAQ
jgi:hypothetical protein